MIKSIYFISIVAVFFTLVGCSSKKPQEYSFDVKEVEWAKLPGNNTISGSGFIRQNGGGVVTCAGSDVILIPYSKYSTERMERIYWNTTKGFINPMQGRIRAIPAPAEFYASNQSTTCDVQGFFKFDNIADGSYYLSTNIIWEVANNEQGGYIMQKVAVSGGEQIEVVLSP